MLDRAKQSAPLNWFRKFMLRHPAWFMFWHWLLTVNGQIALFWLRPRLTKEKIEKCLAYLDPGDAIGTYSRRFPTGWYLPKGVYGVEHSLIYLGNGRAIEAVTPCVRVMDLRELLSYYDKAVVGKLLPEADRDSIVRNALNVEGRIYDTLLGPGDAMLYCHELTANSLLAGGLKPRKHGAFWLFDDLLDCFSEVKIFA